VIAALALAASLWTPGDLEKLRRAIDAALDAPTLRGAHVGVLAIDAADGTPLYRRNDGEAFTPASTFKLLTGSVALARLGPDFNFVTEVDRDGAALVLKGGGDAQLTPADIDAAATAVAAIGAQRFDTLRGDATRYRAARYPDGWSIDDLPYDYAAVPSALSLEENIVHASVVPGNAAGAATTLVTAPATAAFDIENDAVTGPRNSEDTTDVERPWDEPTTIRLTGSVPLGVARSDDLTPAVPDPPAYALDVFRLALLARGVTVASVVETGGPAGGTPLWRHASAPFARMLAQCWQPSDNLLAEQFLLELGTLPASASASADTRERGIALERAWLQSIGVDPATITIADGSGLSEYDRITPAALVAILRADDTGPLRAIVLDALPLAGVRGTLKSSFAGTPLAGTLFAKTGTLNHARALAGYLRTPAHGTVAFALLVDDWTDASPQAAQAIERVRRSVLLAFRG
jgi:D-alanyl-D-alanine carboxypeptidase/D-alanyl-D-alanine-endopeptidase (penicillin-binding protein 4)